MTLEEFMVQAPAFLEAFRSATLHHAATDTVKVWPDNRPLDDWWREVAAYAMFVDAEERQQQNAGRSC